MTYEKYLAGKAIVTEASGFEVSDLNPALFEYQKAIVKVAAYKGRYAIFSDCGTGKTLMQLEWADQVCRHCGPEAKVLIVAPLSVCEQTKREGEKFGYLVNICASQGDVLPGINITNYDKLEKFIAHEFVGVVLDESSILKSFTGKYRNFIIDNFNKTPYKLACTATPSPNDYMELGNHAEFIGVMTRAEMLSMFFVHDGGQTSKWRLKGHCQKMFWEWVASWAVVLKDPKDLGFEMDGFDLPELTVHELCVDGTPVHETLTLTDRRNARRESLEDRCQAAADYINAHPQEQFIVWCNLNDEQKRLSELIGNNVSIQGSTKDKLKIDYEAAWRNGDAQTLISKPLIFGYGMNWQHCHNIIFVGLSDSYEQYYQALRRCWRFGQDEAVNVQIIISAKEGCVLENIKAKELSFKTMQDEMTRLTKDLVKQELTHTSRLSAPYEPSVPIRLPLWREMTWC